MLDLQRPDPQRLRGETRGERQRHLLRQQREIANQHADREQRGEKCDLEQAGVIWREDAPPPVATTLFHLTDRGRDLEPVLRAVGMWGAPMLAAASDEDAFQTHWLKYPLEVRLADHEPDRPPATIQVNTGDEPLVIEVADGIVRTRMGTHEHADAVLSGPHRVVLGCLAGRLTLAEARKAGLVVEGDASLVSRVQPSAAGTA